MQYVYPLGDQRTLVLVEEKAGTTAIEKFTEIKTVFIDYTVVNSRGPNRSIGRD